MVIKDEILSSKQISRYEYVYDFEWGLFFVIEKESKQLFPFDNQQEAVDFIEKEERIEKIKFILKNDR